MAVIIDMDMPKNCAECKISSYVYGDGYRYCPFTEVAALTIGRQDSCPLREYEEDEDDGK